MRIWVQVFSSRNRNPNFHMALEEHLRSVVEPGVEIEVRGTKKGGLGEQFRFFQAIDTSWRTSSNAARRRGTSATMRS
jgi:hypothetical protein